MSKTYIITKEAVNNLGQTVRYEGVVSEYFLQTAITYAELEGYTIVNIEERKTYMSDVSEEGND